MSYHSMEDVSAGPAPEAGAGAPLESELYGGAIVASFPASFTDISAFRPVPDHQEVRVDDKDRSIIIEINTYEAVPDADAAVHHFRDIAGANDVKDEAGVAVEVSQVLDIATVAPRLLENLPGPIDPAKPPVLLGLRGIQNVSKFKEDAKNQVVMYLAVIRLPWKDTDILVTMNAPRVVDPASSSAPLFSEAEGADYPSAGLFQGILASFRIVDWGLFDG